jgi:hypothetical protein
MTVISKQTASHVEQGPGFEARFEEVGDWTVSMETYGADADLASLFAGLPDDACQSIHFGVVLSGQVTFTYADGTEDVIGPGEAYVTEPGHLPRMVAGTRLVEFSRTAELAETIEIVTRNLAAMVSAGGSA